MSSTHYKEEGKKLTEPDACLYHSKFPSPLMQKPSFLILILALFILLSAIIFLLLPYVGTDSRMSGSDPTALAAV